MAQCTAKSKRSGKRCRKSAMIGKNVCYVHGGRSTGPKHKQKNALTTGLKETITRETLTEEEAKYLDSFEVNPIEIMKETIRMLKVKELRIAKRMMKAINSEKEAGQKDKDGKIKPLYVPLTRSQTKILNAAGDETNSLASTSETFAQNYLRLEQAHNTVLASLSRATAQLAAMQAETGEGDEPLPLYTLPPEEDLKDE